MNWAFTARTLHSLLGQGVSDPEKRALGRQPHLKGTSAHLRIPCDQWPVHDGSSAIHGAAQERAQQQHDGALAAKHRGGDVPGSGKQQWGTHAKDQEGVDSGNEGHMGIACSPGLQQHEDVGDLKGHETVTISLRDAFFVFLLLILASQFVISTRVRICCHTASVFTSWVCSACGLGRMWHSIGLSPMEKPCTACAWRAPLLLIPTLCSNEKHDLKKHRKNSLEHNLREDPNRRTCT